MEVSRQSNRSATAGLCLGNSSSLFALYRRLKTLFRILGSFPVSQSICTQLLINLSFHPESTSRSDINRGASIDGIPEYGDYSPAKVGSFRINKQLPNFLFLSAENQKAWAHTISCDASFLRDLDNPVRRCSLI